MRTAIEVRNEFARELEHWKAASERLGDLDAVASPQAWQSLEHYLGVALRQALVSIVERVRAQVRQVELVLRTAESDAHVLQQHIHRVRQTYLRAETAVEFYTDVLAMRSLPRIAPLLRACDHIATRSMAEALTPLGRQVPATLTYLDKGLGASVLKAGLRLWDGTAENPVATIKVTRHNLLRPSSLIHEAGHQVAHMLGWVPELTDALRGGAGSRALGEVWSSWASEISADAFAHVHTGYAAAVALHDVLDSADRTVFQYLPTDPHPISYLRVLMALQMTKRSFGDGPWDKLAELWRAKHPLVRAADDIRGLFEESVRALPRIVEMILYHPYRAFGGQPLTRLIDVTRVSPAALTQLERDAGASAFTSPYWAWNEAIRLTALNGYRAGADGSGLRNGVADQEQWMLKLGGLRAAA